MTRGYRGDGSYADAILLATLVGVTAIGYDKGEDRKDRK